MNIANLLIVLKCQVHNTKVKRCALIWMMAMNVNNHSNVKLIIVSLIMKLDVASLKDKMMNYATMGSNVAIIFASDIDPNCLSNLSKILFRNIAKNLIHCH